MNCDHFGAYTESAETATPFVNRKTFTVIIPVFDVGCKGNLKFRKTGKGFVHNGVYSRKARISSFVNDV